MAEINDFTLLFFFEIGVAPYSARGLHQTLEPIAASIHLERAVNGELIDLSIPTMRKFKSKISCTDQNVPALNGVWPGMVLTVECVQELSFLTGIGVQERTAVVNSVRTEGLYTFYRPVLTMVVTGFSTGTNEYQHDVVWSLDLEEQ